MYRDENTNAIINTDAAALNKYKLERNNQRKVESLAEEVKEIKNTLGRICEMIEKMEKK